MAQHEKGAVPRHVKEAYERGYADGLRAAGAAGPPAESYGDGFCNTCNALVQLMAMGLRHVRLVAEDSGKVIYAKAALATPQWPRHYLLFTARDYPTPRAYLPGLLDKVEACARGHLRPSPDVYHG